MRGVVLVVHALAGWAYCRALIIVGRRVLAIETALVVRAVGVPVGFGVLSWVYHRWIGDNRPVATASAFVGVVVAPNALWWRGSSRRASHDTRTS